MDMTEYVQNHPRQRVMGSDDPDLCGEGLDVGSVSCVPLIRWPTPIFGKLSSIECVTACCCV